MRAFNRIAALVLSLALIAGGLFIAVQAVLATFHRAPWLLPLRRWHDDLVGTRLDDPVTEMQDSCRGRSSPTGHGCATAR